MAGTCSIPEEQILTAALFALGEERTQRLHTFVCNPQQQNEQSEGQQATFEGLSLEQGMAAARARVSACILEHTYPVSTCVTCIKPLPQ